MRNDNQNFKNLKTMTIVNPAKLGSVLGHETSVICGAPRGMTTLVAYYLYELDYFIGDVLGPKNLEDQEFLTLIPSKRISNAPLESQKEYVSLVAKRNFQHSRWGFKLPRASGHINSLTQTLRNPVFIICVRNPLATVRSISNHEEPGLHSLQKMIELSTSYFSAMIELSHSITPSIFINMDEVKDNPKIFAKEFSDAMGLPFLPDSSLEEISSSGYKIPKGKSGVLFKGQDQFAAYRKK